MDELSYLQLLNDDNELLAAEDLLVGKLPSFNVNFEDFFGAFSQTAILGDFKMDVIKW